MAHHARANKSPADQPEQTTRSWLKDKKDVFSPDSAIVSDLTNQLPKYNLPSVSSDAPDQQTPSAETIIELKELTSSECYNDANGALQPLFTGISCSIYPGEVWGIGSSKMREADTLCQIIGNMTAYYKGRCRVGPIGTMQKKRYLLDHLFYIDTPDMIYPNMTVLEQLMFVTMKSAQYPDCVQRQIMLLELLERLRLDYIALSYGSTLFDTEKMLIELIIAFFSSSDLIIFNAVSYEFSQQEIITLSQLVKLIKQAGKTLIIATMQPKLIGISCDHVLFIHEGHQQYCGSVSGLYQKADKVVCMIRDEHIEELISHLETMLPGYELERAGNDTVFIHNPHDFVWNMKDFYRLLAANDLTPEFIKMNKGRVENSFNELTGKK